MDFFLMPDSSSRARTRAVAYRICVAGTDLRDPRGLSPRSSQSENPWKESALDPYSSSLLHEQHPSGGAVAEEGFTVPPEQ